MNDEYIVGSKVNYKINGQIRQGEILRITNLKYFGLLYEVSDLITGAIENIDDGKLKGIIGVI